MGGVEGEGGRQVGGNVGGSVTGRDVEEEIIQQMCKICKGGV